MHGMMWLDKDMYYQHPATKLSKIIKYVGVNIVSAINTQPQNYNL